MGFKVIDKRTGKEPIFDGNHIFKEKWFKESNLIYCDIDGWYISEDGYLVLIDDCGRVGYPPQDRFNINFEPERPHGEWISKPKRVQVDETDEERIFETKLEWFCSSCAKSFGNCKPDDSFCKYCGSDNREEGEEE